MHPLLLTLLIVDVVVSFIYAFLLTISFYKVEISGYGYDRSTIIWVLILAFCLFFFTWYVTAFYQIKDWLTGKGFFKK